MPPTDDTAPRDPSAPRAPAPLPRPADGDPPLGFPGAPGIRYVRLGDVWAALRAGMADFVAAPQFGLFFGGVYVVGGLLLLAAVSVWDTPIAIIPLAIAFPLIGPFIAVGLYEVSRRLSSGAPLRWRAILGVMLAQKDQGLSWMAFVMLFIFWMWAYQVRLLLALLLQDSSFSSLDGFLAVLATTPDGWAFLTIGAAIGAFLSLVLFSVTVLSVPLMLDRDVDFVTAIVTSVASVRRNPFPMLVWCFVVTAAMFAAMAPLFLGLLVVLPVLGHATWRLYERAVVRDA